MRNNTNVPTINVPLLRKVLDHIEVFKAEWDQSTWRYHSQDWEELDRCETVMCFAGHTCHIMGGEWLDNHSALLIANEADDPAQAHGLDGHRTIHASNRAQRLLGLDELDAARLFNGNNSIEDLERLVSEFEQKAYAE